VITAGEVVVALDSGSDRPPGVTARQYPLGFVLDVLGSALSGFKILALVITVWGFASYMVGHSFAKKLEIFSYAGTPSIRKLVSYGYY
jgi:hypothetical protein